MIEKIDLNDTVTQTKHDGMFGAQPLLDMNQIGGAESSTGVVSTLKDINKAI